MKLLKKLSIVVALAAVGTSGSRVNGDKAVMFRSQLNF
jgi:hypothetical protein